MRLVHTTGKTWYKVLHKHTMYVISLSNISIKTNFKQITRVEIRLLNLYTTLRETTFCAWHHVICALLTLQTLDNFRIRYRTWFIRGNVEYHCCYFKNTYFHFHNCRSCMETDVNYINTESGLPIEIENFSHYRFFYLFISTLQFSTIKFGILL